MRRQKRRRKVMMMRAVFFLVLLLIVAGGVFAVSRIVQKKDSGTSGTSGSGKNDTVSNVTVTEAPRETEAVPAATEAVPAKTEAPAQTATSDLQSTLDQAACSPPDMIMTERSHCFSSFRITPATHR